MNEEAAAGAQPRADNTRIPDDLIRMALSDQVSFEAIYKKYGLREAEVKRVMKRELKIGSYIQWRKRVRRRPYKHKKKFSKRFVSDAGSKDFIVLSD